MSVAVATNFGEVWFSDDLTSWTRTLNIGAALGTLSFQPSVRELATFSPNTSEPVRVSADGANWTSGASNITGRGVIFHADANLWVFGGPVDGVFTGESLAGTLTDRAGPSSRGAARTVAYAPSLGRAVRGGSSALSWSDDAISWTGATPTPLSTHNVIWSSRLGLFVSVGSGNNLRTSPDGQTWTSRTSPAPSATEFTDVADNGTVMVAVASAGRVATSFDAVAWTLRTSGTSSDFQSVIWSEMFGLFFAAGSGRTLRTSVDGVSWSAVTGPASSGTVFSAVAETQYNQPPDAPVLASLGVLNLSATNRFGWTFSDPDAGDTQSEFTLEARLQGGSALTVDVTSETTVTHYDVAAGTFAAGLYEWRVRTRDAAGEQGPFSAWEPFEAATPPAGPTITAPVNDGTISTEQFTVEWSAASQDAYQLRRLADLAGSPDVDTVLFDTGQVNTSGARSRTVAFPTNGQTEHVQVRVLRNSLWSPYATVRVAVSYTVPAIPTVAVDDTTTVGAIRVQASHPVPEGSEPNVASVDVFRRTDDDGGDGIRVAADRVPSGVFTDWTVASGQGYAYRVRAYGDNGTSTFSAWSSVPEPVPEPDVVDGGTPSTTGTPVLDGGGA